VKEAVVAAKASNAEQTEPAATDVQPEASHVQSPRTATAPKPAASAPAPVKEAVVAAKAANAEQTEPAATDVQPEASHVQSPRTATAPKPKRTRTAEERTRTAEEAPVERLVKVYDRVLPDGRRVPVYRRAGSGTLEMGTIVDGEYRSYGPARRADLEPTRGRFFGLQ
jgi:hypothetical protein